MGFVESDSGLSWGGGTKGSWLRSYNNRGNVQWPTSASSGQSSVEASAATGMPVRAQVAAPVIGQEIIAQVVSGPETPTANVSR